MKFKIFLILVTIIQAEVITPSFRVNRKTFNNPNLEDLENNLQQNNEERKLVDMDVEAEENYLEAQENDQENNKHHAVFGLPTFVTIGSVVAAYHNLKKNKQLMQKEKLALENIIAKTEQFSSTSDMMKEKIDMLRGNFERFKEQVLKILGDMQNTH